MNAKETLIAALTGIALLASPVSAGGPVLMIEDAYDTAEPAPRNDWIIPVLIGGLVLCAIACGGDDDAPEPPKEPGPVCFDDGC